MTNPIESGGADPMPVAVRIPVAARMLGLGRTKIYELLDTGELASVKVGRARLIVVSSLREFIENRPR
jgi:excisionase family DNA binding protein